MCLVTKTEGSTLWVHHTYRYRLFPNEEHKTLLEKKAREIAQTSPQTYISEKLYRCRSSALWISGKTGRRPQRWAQSLSGLFVDCLDLTGSLVERRDISPPISIQVSKNEDQELPASEASTSNVAIGVTGSKGEPTGERS